MQHDFGMIGLGTMGRNLVLNIADLRTVHAREALELPTIRDLQLTALLHRLAAIGERSRLAAGA